MRTLLILCLLLSVSCEKKQETKKKPPPFVQVAKAIQKDVPYVVRTIGNVEAYSTVDIMPQVSGEMTGFYFKEGSFVDAGQLLFTIDPRPYEAQLEEAVGQLAQAAATFEFDEQRVRRYAELLPEDFVSKLDFEQYVAQAGVGAGQIEQYAGAVAAAEVNLGYTTINSPISGRTSAVLVKPGNIVYPEEQKPLVTIKQIQPIYVTFTAPERYFPIIQKYSHEGTLKVKAVVPAAGIEKEQSFYGSLDLIENQINKDTGTLRSRAEFDNESEHLWPGQFVQVLLELYEIQDAVLVPKRAVQIDAKGPFVFVINKEEKAELRQVTLGQRWDEQVVITKGIEAGEQVVTNGQLSIGPGVNVRIKS